MKALPINSVIRKPNVVRKITIL